MPDKKQSFKEIHGKTRLGLFLKEKAPDLLNKILNAAGDVATGDWGGAIKNILKDSSELTAEEREHALKLIEFDITEQQEITKRWEADAKSESWLPKNVRPLIVLYLVLCSTIVMILDSSIEKFTVKEHWVTLLSSLLITTIAAYFGLREFGKHSARKYK